MLGVSPFPIISLFISVFVRFILNRRRSFYLFFPVFYPSFLPMLHQQSTPVFSSAQRTNTHIYKCVVTKACALRVCTHQVVTTPPLLSRLEEIMGSKGGDEGNACLSRRIVLIFLGFVAKVAAHIGLLLVPSWLGSENLVLKITPPSNPFLSSSS